MVKIIVNKVLTIADPGDLDATDAIYQECTFFITGIPNEAQFVEVNTSKYRKCILVYKQPTLASDIKPYVVAIIPSGGGIMMQMTDTSTASMADTMDRLLCNNFYCAPNLPAPTNAYQFKLGDTQSVDFASFYYLQAMNRVSFSSYQQQTIQFQHVFSTPMPTGQVIFKAQLFKFVIVSMPVCTAKFQSALTIDGELKEGTSVASEQGITIKRLVCAGVQMTDGTGIVKRIEFKNGEVKFFKSTSPDDPEEVDMSFANGHGFSSTLLPGAKCQRVYGGRLVW